MKRIFWVMAILLLMGCSVGLVSKTNTLLEQPFAVVKMRGDITQAVRCVGRHWQNEVISRNYIYSWKVYTESYQVIVTQGDPAPIGLVIDFEEINGETVAKAYCHRIFGDTNPRRTITIEALESCRAVPVGEK